jgi:hypothetical protein
LLVDFFHRDDWLLGRPLHLLLFHEVGAREWLALVLVLTAHVLVVIVHLLRAALHLAVDQLDVHVLFALEEGVRLSTDLLLHRHWATGLISIGLHHVVVDRLASRHLHLGSVPVTAHIGVDLS